MGERLDVVSDREYMNCQMRCNDLRQGDYSTDVRRLSSCNFRCGYRKGDGNHGRWLNSLALWGDVNDPIDTGVLGFAV